VIAWGLLLQTYCNPLAQGVVHRVRQPVAHAGEYMTVDFPSII
jgi:hypothetical protein